MPTIAQVKSAIFDWIDSVLSIPTFWRDQNLREGEISYPYASLSRDSDIQIGRDYTSAPDDAGSALIVSNQEAILSVQIYGIETGASPMSLLQSLKKSLQKRSIRDDLIQGEIVVLSSDNTIRDISNIFGSRNERRAETSFTVRYAYIESDSSVGIIESVVLDGNAKNGDREYPIQKEIDSTF